MVNEEGKLKGFRVVEFATYVAAPSTSRILADWGAEVIKIEPYGGDGYRTNCRIYATPNERNDVDPCFDVCNVNKVFISIDIRTDEGQKILHDLLKDADVFLTNTRFKSLEKLGLLYEQLKDVYPRLVYAHMLGYGECGEERNSAGYDYTCYGARGGITGSLYDAGGPPMVGGPAFGDLQAGMSLAAGIVAALLAREKTGKGDRVSVALHGVGVYMLHLLHTATQFGHYAFPVTRKEAPTPTNNTYQAKDGSWIQLTIPDYNKDFNRFMGALGLDNLKDHPQYSQIAELRSSGKLREFIEIVENQFSTKDASEWTLRLKEADLAHEVCRTSKEVLADQEAWDNKFLRKVEYANGEEYIGFNNPIKYDSIDENPFKPSGSIGADTTDVLSQLGYSEAEIQDMIEKKIIRQGEPGQAKT